MILYQSVERARELAYRSLQGGCHGHWPLFIDDTDFNTTLESVWEVVSHTTTWIDFDEPIWFSSPNKTILHSCDTSRFKVDSQIVLTHGMQISNNQSSINLNPY